MILRLFYSYFAIGILFCKAKLFRLSSSFPDPHFPASGPAPLSAPASSPVPVRASGGSGGPSVNVLVCVYVCVYVWCFMWVIVPVKPPVNGSCGLRISVLQISCADPEPQGMASEVGPQEVRRLWGGAPRVGGLPILKDGPPPSLQVRMRNLPVPGLGLHQLDREEQHVLLMSCQACAFVIAPADRAHVPYKLSQLPAELDGRVNTLLPTAGAAARPETGGDSAVLQLGGRRVGQRMPCMCACVNTATHTQED